MEFIILMILIIVIWFLIAVMMHVELKKHREVTGDNVNYDSFMAKFVYKTNLKREDIIQLLCNGNEYDDITCEFDSSNSIMKFSDYGSNREYFFCVKEYDGFSILRLEQVSFFGMKSHIPYKLNPFMVSKLQAEIVPFSEYGF